MLYYARVNGKILGPLGREELLRLRDEGTLAGDAQWCPADSETWLSPESIDVTLQEDKHPLPRHKLLPLLNKAAMLVLALVLVTLAAGQDCEPATLQRGLFLYVVLFVLGMLARSFSRVGFAGYSILFIALSLLSVLSIHERDRIARIHPQPQPTPVADTLFPDNSGLPDIQPLDYPPEPSTQCFPLYLRRSQTRYSEYAESMARLRDTFTQSNERDTLTVERARYYAEYIAYLPYKPDMNWNNIYETLKTKEGNCATKSIALYDMMMRGGAKNVFWVVGVCYKSPINDTPTPHAWIYWEKDGKRYIIESTAVGMFHELNEIVSNPRLTTFYSNVWPRWGISEGHYYIFGK